MGLADLLHGCPTGMLSLAVLVEFAVRIWEVVFKPPHTVGVAAADSLLCPTLGQSLSRTQDRALQR